MAEAELDAWRLVRRDADRHIRRRKLLIPTGAFQLDSEGRKDAARIVASQSGPDPCGIRHHALYLQSLRHLTAHLPGRAVAGVPLENQLLSLAIPESGCV